MQLAHPRLRHVEHPPDFFHRELFAIVEDQDQSLFLGQSIDGFGQLSPPMFGHDNGQRVRVIAVDQQA